MQKVYNCILDEEIENTIVRPDMLEALKDLTEEYPDVLFSIQTTGGKNDDLIRFYTIYGFTGECDELHTIFDSRIFKEFRYGDLDEDYWGPVADSGEDWPTGTGKNSILYYRGHLYRGHFKGRYNLHYQYKERKWKA